MRKIWLICLVALFLAGCGTEDSETTGTTAVTEETGGCYMADSRIEQETNGAILAYRLPGEYERVVSSGSSAFLTAKTGEITGIQDITGTVFGTMVLGQSADNVQITDRGVGYYLDNQFVLLNPRLQETDRFTLPQTMIGEPLICLDVGTVYYCADNAVRAIDIQTEIDRPLRQITSRSLRLVRGYFGGKVIQCEATMEDETVSCLYISGETGETLYAGTELKSLETDSEHYYAVYDDGILCQSILGSLDGTKHTYTGENGGITGAWALDGIVNCTQTDSGIKLDLYGCSDGIRRASVTTGCITQISGISASKDGIWILSPAENGEQYLYFWQPSLSPVTDETVYLSPFYTADSPDTAGLQSCEQRVMELKKQYGVSVFLWQDAVALSGEHTLAGEYRVPVIDSMLSRVEAALQGFPKAVSSDISIGLVRSVDGSVDGNCQAGMACGIVAPGGAVESVLYRMIGQKVSRKLTVTILPERNWSALNPNGFSYGTTGDYLSGDPWFTDESAMADPHTDRAEIFACALSGEWGEKMATSHLQKKLKTLCSYIRRCYNLKGGTALPWEQYLK